jgi:hypothetical protein
VLSRSLPIRARLYLALLGMPPKGFNTTEGSPSHSRNSSSGSARIAHAPTTPSQLRHARAPSDVSSSPEAHHYDEEPTSYDAPYDVEIGPDDMQLPAEGTTTPDTTGPPDGIAEVDKEPTPRTRLLGNDDATGSEGTTSPRGLGRYRHYGSFAGSIRSVDSFGGTYPGILETIVGDTPSATSPLLGGAGQHKNGKKKSTTRWLAERHGVKTTRMMYFQYYIPIFNWTRQYKWRYLKGDLVAAITMASFYIPMALSYASNLAHVPPVHGLYSFALNPLIYAVLGTCPQMIVGPEAPGSLLVGEIVRENIKKGASGDQDGRRNAEIAGIVTCLAGAFILIAGIFRLGFLDNVLSRPFLRGFISAIGVVIFVDQLIPEMGLAHLAADQVSHGSCMDKVIFLFRNIPRAHGLTCAMSFTAFFVIMFFRYEISLDVKGALKLLTHAGNSRSDYNHDIPLLHTYPTASSS